MGILTKLLGRKSEPEPRPKVLHSLDPWPPANEWAKAKVLEIQDVEDRGGTGTTVWIDPACGKCVIEHNMAGSHFRRRNPDCLDHAL